MKEEKLGRAGGAGGLVADKPGELMKGETVLTVVLGSDCD